jgi:isoleucyl-tRNA synthetase
VDDPDKIMDEFYDLYNYHNNISNQCLEISDDHKDIPVNLLAWTTTPWTLPANGFLAV